MLTLLLFLFQTLPDNSSNYHSFELRFECEKVYINDRNQLYFISKNSNILKSNLQGDSLYTFEDKSQGISAIDATNSMRILAHSNSYNSLYFLDQTLTPISDKIQLDRLNIPFVKAFAFSRDNNFWVFNEADQTLVKLDQHSKIKSVSQKIYLLTGDNIHPNKMLERNNKVFISDPDKGIFQFDFMGTFQFKFDEIRADEFDVIGENIIFKSGQNLYTYNSILMEQKKINIPIQGIDHFCINKNNLVVTQGKKVYIMPLGF